MRRHYAILLLLLAPIGLGTLALNPILYPDGNVNIPPGHAGGPVINQVGGLTCGRSGCHTINATATNGQLSAPSSYLVGGDVVQFTVSGVRGMQVTVANQGGTAHAGTLVEGG